MTFSSFFEWDFFFRDAAVVVGVSADGAIVAAVAIVCAIGIVANVCAIVLNNKIMHQLPQILTRFREILKSFILPLIVLVLVQLQQLRLVQPVKVFSNNKQSNNKVNSK